MAYRRSLITRARLLAQQRFAPSFSYAHYEDDRKNPHTDEKVKGFLQSRSYGFLGNNTNSSLGFGGGGGAVSFRDPRWSKFLHAPLTTSGFLLTRNISTTSEVAVAAAESWPPVAVLQHAIDGIHNFTGLNWWASIVIATVAIRTLLAPITINQHKVASKLTILGPELEQIQQKMQDKSMSPMAVAEVEAQKKRVYMEYSAAMYTQLTRLFIQAPVFVSFFLAIEKMVEKVPSFQTGGASWFIDLTTADAFYILPLLAAISCWITIEALFCYWITSNLFSFLFGLTIKKPSVKKFLNIPIIVPPPPSPATQSKRTITTANHSVTCSSLPCQKTTSEEQKSTTQRLSSSLLLNHRINNLEKQLKGRNKIKRKKSCR
ncbi:mitochondrial inner membrane protein OXA1 isoform X3 [Lactuca sativa]|uniref:mitochondrial inner membrane protein OXA1 isoform X3 n=1 Tax=Lactuca sativa TaxID=4236 RepID=UPI000CD94E32|nr:mitochondrial inner membrane protein OXA1 isoform X3 [Lactuca sativa]